MIDSDRQSGQGAIKGDILEIDPSAALDHAIRLIHQVCCFAGSFDLLDEFRDQRFVCRS